MKQKYKVEPLQYYLLEQFDFEGLWKKIALEEKEKLKKAGKIWTRGESLDGLDPSIRYTIEKGNNPQIFYYPVCIPTV